MWLNSQPPKLQVSNPRNTKSRLSSFLFSPQNLLYICARILRGDSKGPLFSFKNMKTPELLKEMVEREVSKILADTPDHFLVEVKLLPHNKIQVFADADTGIKIEKCVRISRALEQVLDTEKWLGEDYTLEVSSPGMDAPLKVLRQFNRRIGREVEVLKHDGVKTEGILTGVDENQLTLETQKKINKKETVTETVNIPFTQIKHTKLKLNF